MDGRRTELLNIDDIEIQSRLINPNFFKPGTLAYTDSKSPITEFPSVI